MKYLKWLGLGLVILLFAFACMAQTHDHANAVSTSADPNLIDGSKTPTQIPDSVAYRIVLLHLSEANTSGYGFIESIGFTDTDKTAFVTELRAFRSKYDARLANHNVALNAAISQDTSALQAQFHADVSTFVATSRTNFTTVLSADGLLTLDRYVQQAKTHMMVWKGDN